MSGSSSTTRIRSPAAAAAGAGPTGDGNGAGAPGTGGPMERSTPSVVMGRWGVRSVAPGLQAPLDLCDDHLDGDRVVPTARHDHVRIALARLDELLVHRPHGREVLLQ